MKTRALRPWLICIMLAGCSGDDGQMVATQVSSVSDTGEGDGNTFDPSDDDGAANDTGGGTSNDGGNDDGNDDGNDGSGFVNMPDGGGGAQCDVWTQDCPEGQKCAPWANDGGNSWNATKCTPLDPNPKQPGDSCQTDGSDVSGNDDCALGSLCFAVNPETDSGVCTPFCQGSEQSPTCDDPNKSCNISNNGSLILCLDSCDPIAQNCRAVGQTLGCFPVNDNFLCWPVWNPGQIGDPCMYYNVCAPGLYCATASSVPGCVASGCCTEFCDIEDPNATCSLAAGGADCVPWWDAGAAPPGLDHIGGCIVPQ